MKLSTMLKTGSLTALAAAMAVTALPSEALARGDHGRGGQSSDSGDSGGKNRESSRTTSRADRGPSRGEFRQDSPRTDFGSRQSDSHRSTERTFSQPQGQRSFTERGSGNDRRGPDRTVTRTVERSTYTPRTTTRTANTNRGSSDWSRNRGDSSRGSSDWSRNRGDNSRNTTRSSQNYSGSHWGDGDHRQWNRGWRNDNRYDWSGYRRSHHNLFHLGYYYSPYRNYSYRRLGIGFYLELLFFSSNYWIDDPWQYRLPEVYGPYRWVRYYDDALLVDIYTGEVVDVIYDFFW